MDLDAVRERLERAKVMLEGDLGRGKVYRISTFGVLSEQDRRFLMNLDDTLNLMHGDISEALALMKSQDEHWTPTAENVNALPEPIRRYVHDLETRCDPAGDLRELAVARDIIRTLESEQEKRPTVVCLCGSTRFVDVFAVVAWELEKRGKIVHSIHLLPGWYCGDVEDHMAEAQGVAEILDELHLRKIDLADEVMVIDVEGYIGESTSNEIAYAKSLGKPITLLSESEFAAILGTESENGEDE